ncbi:unnamed protein product [Spirodela intermedia]|uniref:Uncharacterized protein n=1 Tax=Spirodela intermedia TaxID=51605 RepID=A0A7I8JAB3_SPIIN|nr:unnamed protein product [Spirodela intermedia]CAA6666373.1 unnamed protein product [Spirodela intermedia]
MAAVSSAATSPFLSQALPQKPAEAHPLLSLLPRCRGVEDLRAVHAGVIKSGALRDHGACFSLGKLVEFCALSPVGDLSYAVLLLESAGPEPHQFLWNTIIRGYSLSRSPAEAVSFYVRMLLAGALPNSHTFPSLFKACAAMAAAWQGRQAHAQALKLGLAGDAFVHTSLINMYARSGELLDARRVFDAGCLRDAVSFTALIKGYLLWGELASARQMFDRMPKKDVIAWNAIIAGFSQSGHPEEALRRFREMMEAKVEPNESTMLSVLSACAQSGSAEVGTWIHRWTADRGMRSSLRLTNALIDMYSKCGDLVLARELFDGTPSRDRISWNVMIGGYSRTSCYREALALFRQMQLSEEPNEVTFLNVLPACAHLGALDIGKWIHSYIKRRMAESGAMDDGLRDATTAALFTSLIDMYAKCGSIEAAQQVFDGLSYRSLSCWNALIAGLALHGRAEEALRYFERMIGEGFRPDDITFVGVLSACCHAGLVEMGRFYFDSMIKDYSISPKVHHYGCMVGILGRAGLLEEAWSLIGEMEVEPDGAIWSSLLGACCVRGHVELAESAASRLIELEPDNASVYVLLSNAYASAGRWDDALRARAIINDRSLKRAPGSSSIEVGNVVHEFIVGDKSHAESREIYQMLEILAKSLSLAWHFTRPSLVNEQTEESPSSWG